MRHQGFRAPFSAIGMAASALASMMCMSVAAQTQSPPPIQDHYAGATLLVAPVRTPRDPPLAVTSEADYVSVYGQQPAGTADPGLTAARLFFTHGGQKLYVASPATNDAAGFGSALADSCVLDVDLVISAGTDCCTGALTDDSVLMNELAAHAAGTLQRFALLNPPQGSDSADLLAFRASLADTQAAALHAPWLSVPDPAVAGATTMVPASAAVAGIISRIDRNLGIHKSPAGFQAEILANGLESDLSADADALNIESINLIRDFSDPSGLFVWGARTLAESSEFLYIGPTRLYRHMKHSVTKSLQWIREAESTDVNPVDVEIRLETWLFNHFATGSLLGSRPNDAYFYSCTAETLSLACLVGIAPISPAEFMVFRVNVPFREVLFRSDFNEQDCG